MAEVITRFKLETTQYDSKLRDAAKGLSDYTKHASLAGSEFAKFTQKNVEAARSFGNIATSATNSKDKVKEMVNAFNDVARAYNSLTKEQQQSDFGKALAESMQQLQGRIREAKQEMNDTGGILGQLKDKFVINIDALKLFQMGLSAAKAALDVAKDAFFNNEQQLDEWGRTIESSESLYKGFLTALNTGDISGYLQRIDEITKAARDAYNALDELNTFNAFNQINVEKTRTGMTESIVDYREGNATKETVKAAGEAYKKELEERRKLEKEAYLKKVAEVAAQRGVSAEDLTTALSGKYGSYKALKEMPMSGTRTVFYSGGMFGGGGSYEQAVPGSVQEKLGDALRRLNDDELKNLQALGAQAERTGNEIAQVDRQLVRVLNGRQGGGGGGGRSGGGGGSTFDISKIAFNPKEVLKGSDDANFVSPYLMMLDEIKEKILDVKDADLGSALDIPDVYQQKIKEMERNLKAVVKSANITADVVGNIGQAFMSIEDPAAKVAGTVMQAIASVALGYAQATVNAAEMGPWAWIAFAASGLATMLATISSIHSATGYASGGEIKGNTYSGDQIPIMANAGEIILNKAQQSSLAQSITSGGGMQNINVIGKLHGTDMVLLVDRTLKTQGKELAVWGR